MTESTVPEKEIMSKADEYMRKSDALRTLLVTSKSARTYVTTGERYYEFVFDEISGSLVKHLKAFGEAVRIRVLATYTIAVTIEINK